MTVQVRPAEPADAEVIVAWEQQIFGSDAWPGHLVPLESTLVAELAGERVGYLVATTAADVADLHRIAVDPERRRQGVAAALLDAARGVVRRHGAQRMLLEVRADNVEARAFYADAGFVQIDQRRGYYRDGTDALVLSLRLGGCGSSG